MATHKQAKKIVISIQMIIFWILIVGIMFVAHYFSSFLEDMVVAGNQFAWIYLFIWYFIWVATVGSIISYILMRGKF